MKKFIYVQDREKADFLKAQGLKQLTMYLKHGKTTWVFEYDERFANEPDCFVTNKLFF